MDFEEVYTREFPGVYKYLLALSGDPALAEELTQETFYRAIQNSETFRGACKLSVWLCQIGKNLYISQLRKERHFKALSPDEMDQERTAHPDPEETLLRRDTAMTLHRLLHALPEPYKEVFSLRILGELSFAQIGSLWKVRELGQSNLSPGQTKIEGGYTMNCDIIKDLLPLYCDGVCSEETSKAVAEHLTACPACRSLLDEMRREPVMPEPIQTQAKQDAKVLQGVKRKFSLRRRRSVLSVAFVALVALVALTASSDIENPIPYQEGMVTAKLAVDEAIDIYFHGNHYASFWAFYRETAEGNDVYFCYTRTLKSSALPLTADHGHICIGNTLMTDFTTASYQVPDARSIHAVYYLEAGQEEYLDLPVMSDAAFTQAAQDAVLLWERDNI